TPGLGVLYHHHRRDPPARGGRRLPGRSFRAQGVTPEAVAGDGGGRANGGGLARACLSGASSTFGARSRPSGRVSTTISMPCYRRSDLSPSLPRAVFSWSRLSRSAWASARA